MNGPINQRNPKNTALRGISLKQKIEICPNLISKLGSPRLDRLLGTFELSNAAKHSVKGKGNPMTLTKSQFIRGKQCVKSLWLQTHKRGRVVRTRSNLRANTGRRHRARNQCTSVVWQRARCFKDGMLERRQDKITSDLISSETKTIYEATFQHSGLLVIGRYPSQRIGGTGKSMR